MVTLEVDNAHNVRIHNRIQTHSALIDSEQTFRPHRPSSVAMHKVRVRRCPIYVSI